jgi:hypothetical protein
MQIVLSNFACAILDIHIAEAASLSWMTMSSGQWRSAPDSQARCVRPQAPGFRPSKAGQAFGAQQRSDLKFI